MFTVYLRGFLGDESTRPHPFPTHRRRDRTNIPARRMGVTHASKRPSFVQPIGSHIRLCFCFAPFGLGAGWRATSCPPCSDSRPLGHNRGVFGLCGPFGPARLPDAEHGDAECWSFTWRNHARVVTSPILDLPNLQSHLQKSGHYTTDPACALHRTPQATRLTLSTAAP
jgi:hypothetical protein